MPTQPSYLNSPIPPTHLFDLGTGRLNDAMREREDYDEDLQALHKLMDRATKDLISGLGAEHHVASWLEFPTWGQKHSNFCGKPIWKTTQNQITCFNRFDDLLGMSDGDEWE